MNNEIKYVEYDKNNDNKEEIRICTKDFIFYCGIKNSDYFYVFRITKRNTFEQYRNIEHSTINDIITHNIKRTSEHRNQLFINQVESPWIKPNIETKNYNKVFFESLKDRHPVDKIWLATHYFDDFRHILAWRMVEKISFKNKISDHTSYNKFIGIGTLVALVSY
mgnify:CR=1 FL=1